MKEEELDWRTKAQHQAIRMADRILGEFNRSLAEGAKLPPIESKDLRHEIFNTFMDGLIGTIIMVGTQWTRTCSGEFEEAVIANIRLKFSALRKAGLTLNREEEKAPIN